MGKYVAIIGGLIALAGGVVLAVIWRTDFINLIQGCIPLFLFFGGLIAMIAGVSSIKDAMRTKKLEEEAKGDKPEAKA
jgi:F0F1-type ATP synthase assembly protein I